jgi:hypothetical protein
VLSSCLWLCGGEILLPLFAVAAVVLATCGAYVVVTAYLVGLSAPCALPEPKRGRLPHGVLQSIVPTFATTTPDYGL